MDMLAEVQFLSAIRAKRKTEEERLLLCHGINLSSVEENNSEGNRISEYLSLVSSLIGYMVLNLQLKLMNEFSYT